VENEEEGQRGEAAHREGNGPPADDPHDHGRDDGLCASLTPRSKNGFGELDLNHVLGHQAADGFMAIEIRIPLGCGPHQNSAPQKSD